MFSPETRLVDYGRVSTIKHTVTDSQRLQTTRSWLKLGLSTIFQNIFLSFSEKNSIFQILVGISSVIVFGIMTPVQN